MACVTIRDLPSRTLGALKRRAEVNNRSLNGEILYRP
ncbi:MAG: Arc family DNA-binding protein [Kiritimatiellae bacterium]|nr:Arc family DNA-binding protein [Kiritimatiellia bacterium]